MDVLEVMVSNDCYKQCGIMFLTLKGNIIFHCSLCEDKYSNFWEYNIHIMEKHHSPIQSFKKELDDIIRENNDLLTISPNAFVDCNELKECEIAFDDLRKGQKLTVAGDKLNLGQTCSKLEEFIPTNLLEEQEVAEIIFDNNGTKNQEEKEPERSCKCPYCKKAFKSKQLLYTHFPCEIKQHTVLHSAQGKKSAIKLDSKPTTEKTQFQCAKGDKVCQKATEIDQQLMQRPLSHKSCRDIEFDGTSVTRRELQRYVFSQTGTTSKRRNENENMHKSLECDKSIESNFVASDSIQPDTANRKPHFCLECSSKFYTFTELKNHMKTMHNAFRDSERKFQCTVCDYACNNKSNLNGHMRRHSCHKPYQCDECSKSFYTNTELKTHIRSHTGERPFLCTDCGDAFSTSSKLSFHLKKHYNIRDKACPVCDMKFISSQLLRHHMAVHSNDRPYKCDLCEAAFKQPVALRSHIKLHENKRTYQCTICSAGFNQQAGLYSHMKSKHSVTAFSKAEGL